MGTLSNISIATRSFMAGFHLFRQSSYKDKLGHASRIHKEYICNIQGNLADFALLARLKHENLRSAVSEYELKINAGPKRPPPKTKIRGCLKELEGFLQHGQAIACKTTFESLKAHFSTRIKPNLFPPRYCIKLVDHDCVFTFLRDRGKSAEGRKPIKDEIARNTGFQYIKDAGVFYLCNNIPEEAKFGRYINPRLRTQCAIEYSPSLMQSTKRACSLNKPIPDHSWINCWNKDENMEIALIAEICYKSTLIVPMALRFDQVSTEFWGAFNQSGNTSHPFEKGSFGFLCIDSHEEDFFEQDVDSNFGYVCADMLSLFYIATFLYTSLSPAYSKANSILAFNRGDGK